MGPKLRSDSTTTDLNMQQILERFDDNRDYMEKQFNKLNATISSICSRLDAVESKQTEYEQALTFCGEEIADLKKKLNVLKQTRQQEDDSLRSQMSALVHDRHKNSEDINGVRDSLDKMHKEKSYLNLTLSGIPVTPRENTCTIVTMLAAKMEVSITEADLITAYRTKNRNIYVKFHSQIMRDKLYNARKQLQTKEITTKSLGLSDDVKIYINEVLDEKQHELFFKARKRRKELNYRYIWTYHGNIYMKQDSTSDILKITSSADLSNLE